MADTLTVEHHIRIYNDQEGYYVTVRPDRDGLNLCEIAYNDGDQAVKDERSIMIPWNMAKLMAEGILGIQPAKEHPCG